MWPWSKPDRSPLEQLLRGENVQLRADLAAERENCAQLLAAVKDMVALVAELKREGFAPPAPLPDVPPPDALPAEVLAAIRRRAQPGSDLWAQLESFARDELALATGDSAPAAIAKQILAGRNPDDFGV